jgi:hypothetical protein
MCIYAKLKRITYLAPSIFLIVKFSLHDYNYDYDYFRFFLSDYDYDYVIDYVINVVIDYIIDAITHLWDGHIN